MTSLMVLFQNETCFTVNALHKNVMNVPSYGIIEAVQILLIICKVSFLLCRGEKG